MDYDTPDVPEPNDGSEAPLPPTTNPLPLFKAASGRQMPAFSKKSRPTYPFDALDPAPNGKCYFPAGKEEGTLKLRLYVAMINRRITHPDEEYKLEITADGDMYVWRTQ